MPYFEGATIPYGANMIKNPSAQEGDLTDWTDDSNVTVVAGGIDNYDTTPYCFRFEPTAYMKQRGAVPGLPPDVEFSFYFLPGRDINSSSAVKGHIILTFEYANGAKQRLLIPGKSFIEGYFV